MWTQLLLKKCDMNGKQQHWMKWAALFKQCMFRLRVEGVYTVNMKCSNQAALERAHKATTFFHTAHRLPTLCACTLRHAYLCKRRAASVLKLLSSQTFFFLHVPTFECLSFTVWSDVRGEFDTSHLFSCSSTHTVNILCFKGRGLQAWFVTSQIVWNQVLPPIFS